MDRIWQHLFLHFLNCSLHNNMHIHFYTYYNASARVHALLSVFYYSLTSISTWLSTPRIVCSRHIFYIVKIRPEVVSCHPGRSFLTLQNFSVSTNHLSLMQLSSEILKMLNLRSHYISYSAISLSTEKPMFFCHPTNRAKLESFKKVNAGNPHKYRLSAF